MKTRITINGREVDHPEALPPELRRAYEDAMRSVSPPGAGLVVENQIVVNGQTYRRPDDMPPEVRRLYEDAMAQARRGSGITVTHTGPRFSIGFARGGRPASPELTGGKPRPIEPTVFESNLRNAVVGLALMVIGGLVAWALLGR